MENLTTIWYYNESVQKWIRSKDVVISSAKDKLADLVANNPHKIFKISDKHPTKKP